MNELIAVVDRQIGGVTVQTVNARDLHAFLGVKKDFSDWIKAQIERARLVEGRDFLKLPQKGELSATGQARLEYFVTLDAAKHIGMLSGTEKGFELREYFLECERRAHQAPPPVDPMLAMNDPKFLRKMLLSYTEQVLVLQPKADAHDRLAASVGSMCLRDAASHLNAPERKFIAALAAHEWIYRRPGKVGYLAFAPALRAGVLEHKVHTTRESPDAPDRVHEQVLVTPFGLTRLARRLVEWGVLEAKQA